MSSFQLQADYQAGPLSKPIVIGIYGLPGCGKSYLLHQLKEKLVERPFQIFEGSEVITSLHPGGLDAFKKLAEDDKVGGASGLSTPLRTNVRGQGVLALCPDITCSGRQARMPDAWLARRTT